MSEYEVNDSPTDAISSVRFSPKNSQYLLASSWDSHVRLYDIESNTLKVSYKHEKPVLDCCFMDSGRAFSVGLDGKLKLFDFQSQRDTTIGSHRDAIRCVQYCPGLNLAITGSWDETIKLWDVRTPGSCVGTYEQPGKVYTMDTCDDKLVVGTADRKIRIWTLTNMGMPESRESSLKYQTRCIRCFPNRQGYVVSSIEGRVAVEYFDMSPDMQRQKYAFKCHRSKDESNVELVYPVNAIAFHNLNNTFATGGSDCMVNIWDPFNKKRLCQFHSYPTSITSLSFDHNGSHLAIASSYMFERGGSIRSNPFKETIYIRKVSDLETKAK